MDLEGDERMDFAVPARITDLLRRLDEFIAAEIAPLERQDDNARFFDHRREWARTDFEAGGLPRADWEELLAEMRRRADRAGFLRFGMPAEVGGQDGSNLEMAFVRQHLAAKGLGLHNDLQNESSIVGNFPLTLLVLAFGTPEQRAGFVEPMLSGTRRCGFGLTEPDHGSDATWMETTARRDGGDWVLTGAKRWNSGIHHATHDLVFARTSGAPGDARGITAFLVPMDTPGVRVESFMWTFNMPTDHGEVSFTEVRVPDAAILGGEGEGLAVASLFVQENRIRQAASSLGAAQFCIAESVRYAKERVTFGQPLAQRQAVQWPLVELATEAEMLQALIRQTAWTLDDTQGEPAGSEHASERRRARSGAAGDVTAEPRRAGLMDKVSMCNYRANRLACDAADRAMQVHGGLGYSRHTPFEHIYRHHRRYRITEGAEEIQIRRVAQHLFGIGSSRGSAS